MRNLVWKDCIAIYRYAYDYYANVDWMRLSERPKSGVTQMHIPRRSICPRKHWLHSNRKSVW